MFENKEEFHFRADARILGREKDELNIRSHISEEVNEMIMKTYQMVNDFLNQIHRNFDGMNCHHWVIVNLYFEMS